MNKIKISLISVFIIACAYVLYNKYYKNAENFKPIGNGGSSGFGYQPPASDYPLFQNFYPQQLGQDFGLFSTIQKLKFYNIQFPTGNNGYQKGVFTNTGHGQVNTGRTLSPIILVPGLGASKIFGQWNKTQTQAVKQLDAFGNFEISEKWKCRQNQPQWTELWFPENETGLSQYCWQDNTSVYLQNNNIINSEGVITTVPHFGDLDFQPTNYMGTMIEALEALGYMKGTTLFGASYDFRKICSPDEMDAWKLSFKSLIERSVSLNRKKAILIGHSLGSTLVNYFLTTTDKEWKDRYIQSFVSFSGAFGGCPKALRVLLSGDSLPSKEEQKVVKYTTMNFTGLHWMLPSPAIYGDIPLLHYRQVSYGSKDLPEIMKMADFPMAADIYTNLVGGIQAKSMEAPGVATYIMAGTNVNTESSYMYDDSLLNDPVKNYPYYQTDKGNNNQFNYPQLNNGDGSMPKFALEFPLTWSNYQKEPIHFRFYERAEHTKIMSMKEPIEDLLEVVKQMNNRE